VKLTIEDLTRIKEAAQASKPLRDAAMRAKVTVHMGTCGIASGARPIMTRLLDVIRREGINDVVLSTSGCAGLCSSEPMITVELTGQGPVKYANLDPDSAEEVFRSHVLEGRVAEKYVLAMGVEKAY